MLLQKNLQELHWSPEEKNFFSTMGGNVVFFSIPGKFVLIRRCFDAVDILDFTWARVLEITKPKNAHLINIHFLYGHSFKFYYFHCWYHMLISCLDKENDITINVG